MFKLIKKVIIALFSRIESLASKRVSSNNETCMIYS